MLANTLSASEDMAKAAHKYFGSGRCSGHAQFNGRHCRDVVEPRRWCIHCVGFMLMQELAEAQANFLKANHQTFQALLDLKDADAR